MYRIIVLELRRPGLKYQPGWFLVLAMKVNLFNAPPLPSGGLLELWLVDTASASVPSCPHGIPSLFMFPSQICPFYMDTSHTGVGPTLLHYDYILTNYIFNDLISK